MLVFGYKNIRHLPFFEIISYDDLKDTFSNSVAVFDFDVELIDKCRKNSVKCAVKVKKIKDLIFCNALECDFVIVDKSFSDTAQKLANEYLFDTKIIQTIINDNEFEDAALRGIDAVILKDSIKRFKNGSF